MSVRQFGDAQVERVLIPTDGSESSQCAVDLGLRVAASNDADVHALYVVETERALGHVDFAVERQEETGEEAVETVEERAGSANVPVTKAFRYGTTHEEIVDYALAYDADLIVIGTRGRSGVARLKAGGSVATRVVQRASVPVLVAGEETCGAGAPLSA